MSGVETAFAGMASRITPLRRTILTDEPIDRLEYHGSTAGLTLEYKDEIGLLRVIAGDEHRFLGITAAGFRIEFQSDRSLAAGRNGPVKLGHHTASAGHHFFYVQH